ncbi:uncharacterized peptidase C1-like protein F26E4.3, partial [Anneissia japonica]|uniref:uncharacterized peptidase C1-like protein F26E4.3 n=1 Tax=Anneissia japonica TaxID=1529436 RepID=UPI0014257684
RTLIPTRFCKKGFVIYTITKILINIILLFVAVASDRLAIQSMGNMKVILSPQHLLSCNTRRQRGCDGGYTDRAWYFLRKKGIVTDECYPYKSGMDSGMTMKKGHCMLPPPDHSPCPNEYVHSDAYKSTPPYRIGQEENEI